MQQEFIYMIRIREFVNNGENIYKIGRTKQQPNSRLSGYPKGSQVIMFEEVYDCVEIEKIMMKKFKKKFIQKTEYGIEYFLGDKKIMLDVIHNIISKYNSIPDDKKNEIYLSNLDNIQKFIMYKCNTDDKDVYTRSIVLYEHFIEKFNLSSSDITQNKFSRLITSKGYNSKKINGFMQFRGIQIIGENHMNDKKNDDILIQ